MAVSGRRSGQLNFDHDEPWKLKDKVRVLKICSTDNGNEKLLLGATKPTEKFKQGPKVSSSVNIAK